MNQKQSQKQKSPAIPTKGRRTPQRKRPKGAAGAEAGPFVLRLVLRGLAHQALIAMCKSEGETPNEWLKKSVCAEIVEFFDFNLNGQHFPQMLERDVEV